MSFSFQTLHSGAEGKTKETVLTVGIISSCRYEGTEFQITTDISFLSRSVSRIHVKSQVCLSLIIFWGLFPDSSVGQESSCNAGYPGLIPGLGRTPGEGIGYPLQYSWASLVTQLVKNSAAMGATWVRSLGWDDCLENGKYSGLENSMDCMVCGVTKSQTGLGDFHFHYLFGFIS